MIDPLPRRRRLRLLAAATLVTATLLLPAPGRAAPPELSPDRWAEDLDLLVRRLERDHPDPFRTVAREDFLAASAALRGRLDTISPAAVEIELARLVALLGDAHTELSLLQPAAGLRTLPLALYLFGDELRVIAVPEAERDLLGARVVSVGSRPAGEALAAVEPLLSRDNPAELRHSGPAYLGVTEVLAALGLAPDPGGAVLGLELLDGRRVERRLEGAAAAPAERRTWLNVRDAAGVPPPLYLSRTGTTYWHAYLPEHHTLYVQVNGCEDQDAGPSLRRWTRALLEEARDLDVWRVVVDLRLNNGGNYHKTEPLVAGLARHYRGRVVGLTGRRTFSAATVAALQLRQQAEAVLLGEPARSNPNLTENMETLTLPNSRLRVDYTTRLHRPAPELGDSPVLPVDREVALSFADYRAGRDPVLAAALAWPLAPRGGGVAEGHPPW